jgi:hypothetical protein
VCPELHECFLTAGAKNARVRQFVATTVASLFLAVGDAEGQGRQPSLAGTPWHVFGCGFAALYTLQLKTLLNLRGAGILLPGERKPPLFNLTSSSPVRYNFAVMPLYATPPRVPPSLSPSPCIWPASARRGRLSAWPLPCSVSWRHSVPGTLKTDIKNEAASLLKTKGRNLEFSRWRSH